MAGRCRWPAACSSPARWAASLWGAFKRTPSSDAARLADRAWGLEDRVATAIEWAGRSDRTPMVDALVADVLGRIDKLEPRVAARRVIPRDGRFLPIPLALAVLLALSPAVPLPSGRLPNFSSDTEEAHRRAAHRLEHAGGSQAAAGQGSAQAAVVRGARLRLQDGRAPVQR